VCFIWACWELSLSRQPTIHTPIGRVIQGFYLPVHFTSLSVKGSLPGLQTFQVFTLGPLLFRDFDVMAADEPAGSMFLHLNPDVLP
jgi:hypothetical protein